MFCALALDLCLGQQPSPASDQNKESLALQHTEKTTTKPKNEYPQAPFANVPLLGAYKVPSVPPLSFSPADQLGKLTSQIRDGKLGLSLQDAIALAIQNNLDADIRRYDLAIADTDLQRTKGGGISRGVSFVVAQTPAGVGGPISPLLNIATANSTPTAPTVSTTLFDVNQITEPQTNLSIQGGEPFSNGSPTPVYDPSFVGQLAWVHRQPDSAGAATLGINNSTFTNLSLIQGFSTGLSLEAGLSNNADVNSGGSFADPFHRPNLILALNQPLLRGFGVGVNRRFIRVAQNNQKISRLVFRQQLVELVFGISRLYYDLVSLNEDVKVKQDALNAAKKLLEDDTAQVDVGTLAPLELTRVKALVAAAEVDLIRSQGLFDQQEITLKNQLSRRGTADPAFKGVHILPTEVLTVPASDNLPLLDDLIVQALSNRADLAQAEIQVTNGHIALEGSRNQVLPEIDLIANAQSRGNFGQSSINSISQQASAANLGSGAATSKLFEAGVQVNLPIRNRIAQADATRDTLQVRQMEARLQQLKNQIQEEVENARRAVEIARAAYTASVQSRTYQEELLAGEREKLSVGASANFFIVQDESLLAQARSAEVAARSAYIKARSALDRALGNVLENNHIDLDDAIRNQR
jgi:outer membrane protein TolC